MMNYLVLFCQVLLESRDGLVHLRLDAVDLLEPGVVVHTERGNLLALVLNLILQGLDHELSIAKLGP